jgi:Domain of unknown function (DUF4388)
VENIERTEFVVLTGHLDEQPLPGLIRRLRVQRKSGRLQVEYPETPGSFFFEDGQLVDARLGALRGVEALYTALSLGGASFNFNPLVRPPERSIDRQGQQFIRELIEAPRRESLPEINAAGREVGAASAIPPAPPAPLQLPAAAAAVVAPLEARLTAVEEAIVSTSRRFSRERLVYSAVVGFLGGLCLVATLNLIFDPFRSGPAAATAVEKPPAAAEAKTPPQPPTPQPTAETAPEPAEGPVPSTAAVIGTRRAAGVAGVSGEYVVQVLVEVKGGRVVDARVWNPRPGAGPYEAVALRMARERRYPESFTGAERVRIRVAP